jgi:predicted RNA-binding protein associated with RNAse of E/G family
LAPHGASHSIGVFWDDETDDFRGWYVQLGDPLRPSRFGFDTMDHALDVWIRPDGSWEWKDEDDFAEAQELGVFTPEQAAAIRAEGERVLAARPWPTGWEEWGPDPGWRLPQLPAGWDLPD